MIKKALNKTHELIILRILHRLEKFSLDLNLSRTQHSIGLWIILWIGLTNLIMKIIIGLKMMRSLRKNFEHMT